MTKWLEEHIIAIVFILIVSIGIAIALAAYQEAHEPQFMLNKADWICTQHHTDIRTDFIVQPNGQTAPLIVGHDVCDQYTRRIK